MKRWLVFLALVTVMAFTLGCQNQHHDPVQDEAAMPALAQQGVQAENNGDLENWLGSESGTIPSGQFDLRYRIEGQGQPGGEVGEDPIEGLAGALRRRAEHLLWREAALRHRLAHALGVAPAARSQRAVVVVLSRLPRLRLRVA